MKKLFNDNAKTIALLAIAGCVVMGIVLYKQSHKKPCNPQLNGKTKVATEEVPAENEETANAETK